MSKKKFSKEKIINKINKDVSDARREKNKSYKKLYKDINDFREIDILENDYISGNKIKNKNLIIGKFVGKRIWFCRNRR